MTALKVFEMAVKPPSTPRYYEPPAWMEAWQPRQPVPVSREDFELQAGKIDAALEPASPKEIAVALKRITSFLSAFGIMPAGADEIVIGAYRDALHEVPADLLGLAVHGATVGLRYSRPPLPADLVAGARAEIAKRSHARAKAQLVRLVMGWW